MELDKIAFSDTNKTKKQKTSNFTLGLEIRRRRKQKYFFLKKNTNVFHYNTHTHKMLIRGVWVRCISMDDDNNDNK